MKIPFSAPASRSPLPGLLTALALVLSTPLHAADKGDAAALRPAAQDKAAASTKAAAGTSTEGLKASASQKATDTRVRASDRAAPSRGAATSSTPDKGTGKAAMPPTGAKLDLNSASEAELATLPGIGAARAKAIIKGRPYTGKDDLKRRKIVPAHVYEDIKARIIAHQR